MSVVQKIRKQLKLLNKEHIKTKLNLLKEDIDSYACHSEFADMFPKGWQNYSYTINFLGSAAIVRG